MRLKVNALEILLLFLFTIFIFYVIKEVTVNPSVSIILELPVNPSIYDLIRNFDFLSLKSLGYNYISLKVFGNFSLISSNGGMCCSLLMFPRCASLNLSESYSLYRSVSIKVRLNETAFRNNTYKIKIPLSYFNGCVKSFIIFDEFGNMVKFRYYLNGNYLNIIFRPVKRTGSIYLSCLNLTLRENLVDESMNWNELVNYTKIFYEDLNIFVVCYNCTDFLHFTFSCENKVPFIGKANYSENFSYCYVSARVLWFNPIMGNYSYLDTKAFSGKCVYFDFVDERGIKYTGELC